jgi:hypothetical protein
LRASTLIMRDPLNSLASSAGVPRENAWRSQIGGRLGRGRACRRAVAT